MHGNPVRSDNKLEKRPPGFEGIEIVPIDRTHGGAAPDGFLDFSASINPLGPPQAALDEYIRCYTLKTITGSCRDFRASPTSDFEMDAADLDRQIAMPTLILWGARGQPPDALSAQRLVTARMA